MIRRLLSSFSSNSKEKTSSVQGDAQCKAPNGTNNQIVADSNVCKGSKPKAKSAQTSSLVDQIIKKLMSPEVLEVTKLRAAHCSESTANPSSSSSEENTKNEEAKSQDSSCTLKHVDLITPASQLTPEQRQDKLYEIYLRVSKIILSFQNSVFNLEDKEYDVNPLCDALLLDEARAIIAYLYASADSEAKQIREQVKREMLRKRRIEFELVQSPNAHWEYIQVSGARVKVPENESKQIEAAFCNFLSSGKPMTVKYTASAGIGRGDADYSITFKDFVESGTYMQAHHSGSKHPLYRIVSGGPVRLQELKVENELDSKQQPKVSRECQICYTEFSAKQNEAATPIDPDASQSENNDLESCKSILISTCGHETACQTCFATYIESKVRKAELMPFIRCPHPDCKLPITSQALYDAQLPLQIYYAIAKIHLQKVLSRIPDWVSCKNDNCSFGFLYREESSVSKKLTCLLCNSEQTVTKDAPELDEEIQKLHEEGTVRLCPKCKFPAMREYGMCNVMECAQCGIFWNWRTMETAHDSNTLKQIARCNGTLWELGNLEYQQRLQRENLPEFIELLKRNGIDYDPRYRRGQ